MNIKLSSLSKEQYEGMPKWVKSNEDSVQLKFERYIFNIVCSYTKKDKHDAIDAYVLNLKKNPDWKEVFENEYITDEMIKLRYKKNPSDISEGLNMSYRDVINAMLYKAFIENRGQRTVLLRKAFLKQKKRVIKTF